MITNEIKDLREFNSMGKEASNKVKAYKETKTTRDKANDKHDEYRKAFDNSGWYILSFICVAAIVIQFYLAHEIYIAIVENAIGTSDPGKVKIYAGVMVVLTTIFSIIASDKWGKLTPAFRRFYLSNKGDFDGKRDYKSEKKKNLILAIVFTFISLFLTFKLAELRGKYANTVQATEQSASTGSYNSDGEFVMSDAKSMDTFKALQKGMNDFQMMVFTTAIVIEIVCGMFLLFFLSYQSSRFYNQVSRTWVMKRLYQGITDLDDYLHGELMSQTRHRIVDSIELLHLGFNVSATKAICRASLRSQDDPDQYLSDFPGLSDLEDEHTSLVDPVVPPPDTPNDSAEHLEREFEKALGNLNGQRYDVA